MNEHGEPWEISEKHPNVIVGVGHFDTRERAQRARACVNACAGIPTDVLEREGRFDPIETPEEARLWTEQERELTALRAQRDELASALRAAHESQGDLIAWFDDNVSEGDVDGERAVNRADEAQSKIEAALAKLTEEVRT